MKLIVRVSEENIRYGLPCEAFHCPVALALNDLGLDACISCLRVMCYENGSRIWAVALPREEQERIEDYDRSGIMQPHEFELEVPGE